MDKSVKPVVVVCPYSNQMIDITPLLNAIHYGLDGWECATEYLSVIIEDMATYSESFIDYDPDAFCSEMGYLRSLRRAFTEISKNIKTINANENV